MSDFPADYLAGLPEAQQAELAKINKAGLEHLRDYLRSGDAVAFLGAGASAPLYPLWDELIGQLVSAAADRLTAEQAQTCRALAVRHPEEVVEIARRYLGIPAYREVLRELLRARTEPESGRSWTAVHELVCRCNFRGVVTTNYDPGIVTARMHVRPGALDTGFTAWDDELGMDGWRTGDVFGDVELPVLYAHGLHSRPDSVVLAATEYRRAYEGKLSRVLAGLVDGGHLVWIGFSFADQRIAAILREIEHWSGSRAEPGAAIRHVAIMPWDPEAADNAPEILAQQAEIGYGARVVLYPAPGGDHFALRALLSSLTDARFPPSARAPGPPVTAAETAAGPKVPVTWIPPAEPVPHFTGRAEELARLDRWAADPQVSLVAVTAWGGAGKTALVTHWVQRGGWIKRPGIRGVFGWSFYAEPSAEQWAGELLGWAKRELGVAVPGARPASAVLALLRRVPLLLVLDGLEVVQEGPAGGGFGRLLDGMLREVLVGACRLGQPGQIVLTSRFPFADLEAFDGSSARMLEVPPFTPTEGAALLAATGGSWIDEKGRRGLVAAVDGHALAVGVLAGLLADRVPPDDLASLRDELASAVRTSARVGRVLRFYSDRLTEPDRYLVAAVALFSRPVPAPAVLTVAGHEAFAGHLAGWTSAMVETAVCDRLSGLLSWHPDRTISAHPLVRERFRPLAMGAAELAAETSLTGMPEGEVATRADALRVVEAIELLLDAGQWQAAEDLYDNRFGPPPSVWATLPAAGLGQRANTAFVATAERRKTCAELTARGLGLHLSGAGLFAMEVGDLAAANDYQSMDIRHCRESGNDFDLAVSLLNQCSCLAYLGEIALAQTAAGEALAAAADDCWWKASSESSLGLLAELSGSSAEAEKHFNTADRLLFADDAYGWHLDGFNGCEWADWLLRTGRLEPARVLTERNRELCDRNDWTDDVARCDGVLGRVALAAGQAALARQRLTAAAECFRDGEYLIDYAITLVDLAECARVAGDLDAADAHATEALTIASPRGLVSTQSAALAARARIRADRVVALDPDQLAQGRDAAEAALRLAARRHRLPWAELDALRAHAALDRAEGTDHGWAARADALHARLVPAGLDPDPLATVERQVAAEKAAEEAHLEEDQ